MLSACSGGETEETEYSIDGIITGESGSEYDYIGWWELTETNTDAPFVYIEIYDGESGIMVRCYDSDKNPVDEGGIDYSEQRELNGNSLMVFMFSDIGEYGVTPYNSGDDRYLNIGDAGEFINK